jgi:lipoprotein-anchoring transpeptidase ErfK/SrfK
MNMKNRTGAAWDAHAHRFRALARRAYPPGVRRHRAGAVPIVLAAVMAAAVAGCSDDDTSRRDSTAQRTVTRPALPKAGPLRLETGLRGQTTWTARVMRDTLARSAPRGGAPAWLQVLRRTPYSGREARLMVTGAYRDRTGREWVRVQLALRPNGTTAWIPRSDVRLTATRYRVHVDLSERRLDLFRDGRRVASYPAGVGRPEYPTPAGRFAVEDMMRSPPSWRPKYGGYVFTITGFSNVLTSFMGGDGQSAIHGSGSLGRVGRAASFGCVVLADAALEDLYRRIRPGTPVEIEA